MSVEIKSITHDGIILLVSGLNNVCLDTSCKVCSNFPAACCMFDM